MLSSVACPAAPYYSTLSHKWHDFFLGGGEEFEQKLCFDFLYNSCLKHSSSIGTATVVVCSTIDEYSQQECFYRVPLPAAGQTPQLGGPVITTFQLPPSGVCERANPSSGRWNYGREIAENFAESGDFHFTF